MVLTNIKSVVVFTHMKHEFTLEVELPNRKDLVQIPVTVESEWDNDGIGAYEYWGSKGFDKGNDYVEIYDVDWDKTGYTPEEVEIVEAAIDDNMEAWATQIEGEFEPDYDYPEPDDRDLEW